MLIFFPKLALLKERLIFRLFNDIRRNVEKNSLRMQLCKTNGGNQSVICSIIAHAKITFSIIVKDDLVINSRHQINY